jgi:hypothetical protein
LQMDVTCLESIAQLHALSMPHSGKRDPYRLYPMLVEQSLLFPSLDSVTSLSLSTITQTVQSGS